MIRTHQEYERALQYLQGDSVAMSAQRTRLLEMGIKGEELERAMQPMESFRQQVVEEVEAYERLRQPHQRS